MNDVETDGRWGKAKSFASRSRFGILFFLTMVPCGLVSMMGWQKIEAAGRIVDLEAKLNYVGGEALAVVTAFGFMFVAFSVLSVMIFSVWLSVSFWKLSIRKKRLSSVIILNTIASMPLIWLLSWIYYIDGMSLGSFALASILLLFFCVVERPLSKPLISFMSALKKKNEE